MRRLRYLLRGRGRGREATAILALLCGCAYYSEDLLLESGGGVVTGGSGASAGSLAQAGRGGSAGDAVGTAGSDASGGTSGGGSSSSGSSSGGESAAGGAGATGGASDSDDGGSGGDTPLDDCPGDPDKTKPGECGCGIAESCAPLRAALMHRYSFEMSGSLAHDSIGDADATIVGVSAADGRVELPGGTTAAYVDLPDGIISALTDASFEVWLEWSGGASWQRILDFGSNDVAEGSQGVGRTYLYLSPSDGEDITGNPLRASFSLDGIDAETTVRASAPLPTAALQHIVLVVDDTNNQLRLYLDGEVSALTGFNGRLSSLDDVNNWLGRSNYKDPHLAGSIEEFRIYGAALSNAQVAASSSFGPNPEFL